MHQSDLRGRLTRWFVKLQGYTLNIFHCRGTQNVFPDCLYRQNFEEVSELDLPYILYLNQSSKESYTYIYYAYAYKKTSPAAGLTN